MIDSLQRLLEDCYQDFGLLYDRLRLATDIEAHEVVEGDRILSKGDFHYF